MNSANPPKFPIISVLAGQVNREVPLQGKQSCSGGTAVFCNRCPTTFCCRKGTWQAEDDQRECYKCSRDSVYPLCIDLRFIGV